MATRRQQVQQFTEIPFSAPLRGWVFFLTLSLTACSSAGVPASQEEGPVTPPTELERVMLREVNAARLSGQDCGAKGDFTPAAELELEPHLSAAAQAHADDMRAKDYFSHTAPDGSTVGTRVTRTGYRWSRVGENIAQGYKNVDEVMAGWLESDGHCANLLNPGFSELGVGKSGDYWVQVFAKAK